MRPTADEKVIARLWRDWQLMQTMRCTWTDLNDQPFGVMEVVERFVKGQEEGLAARAEADAMSARGRAS